MPLTSNEFDNISRFLKGPPFFHLIHSYHTVSTWKKAWFCFSFWPAPHIRWDPTSLTRGWASPSWSGDAESQTKAPGESVALAESNRQQKGQVAGAGKDFEIHTLRNSLRCVLTDVICLNTSHQQELTTSEAAHFLYRLWHSLENSLMRPQLIIHGFIVLGSPLGIT